MSDQGRPEDRAADALRRALADRDAALRHAEEAVPDEAEERVMARFRAIAAAGEPEPPQRVSPVLRGAVPILVRLAAVVALGVVVWMIARPGPAPAGMVLLGDRLTITVDWARSRVSWTEPEPGCVYDVTIADALAPATATSWLAHEQTAIDIPAALRAVETLSIGVVARKGGIAVGAAAGEVRRP